MKKITKTIRGAALIASYLLVLGIQNGFAQANTTVKYAVSFTQTTSTNYEVSASDRERLQEFERVGMVPTNEVRNVNVVVDQNNDVTTTITIVSSDASESWMTPATKIVIDKNGSTFYNAQNAILTRDNFTTEQAQDYLNQKNTLAQNGSALGLPQFQPITASDIAQLQSQGFSVQMMDGGTVKARKGQTEIQYNNSAMSVNLLQYDESNKIASDTGFKFANQNGRTIPVSRTEREYQTTQSGVCISVVTTTTYSNYNPIGLP
ncbi:MAG: hypothetical protein JNJ57_00335 [Saprospiraceae bacterium]|nr:hypothetical protein [Saprospiraceae bacterium]